MYFNTLAANRFCARDSFEEEQNAPSRVEKEPARPTLTRSALDVSKFSEIGKSSPRSI